MDTDQTHENHEAVDRISDSVRHALAGADSSSDIHEIVECARAALIDADAVSLFGLETPHPDFGSLHWIVGQTDRLGGDYLVLAIPEHISSLSDGWPLFAAGSDDLGEAFRQFPPSIFSASPGANPTSATFANT